MSRHVSQHQRFAKIHTALIQGGNVPGGHEVINEEGKKPFLTPMKECNSIPLRYSDIVVDIGAYVGTYAIRCARFPVQQVIAYEPTPQTFQILARTRLPNLLLKQMAVVGQTQDTTELYLSAGIGVTNSIVLSHRKAGVITVPAISYVQAVAGASIVKIDVEGAEYTYPIVQPSLRAVIIDFHPIPNWDWIGAAHRIMEQLADAGFETVIAPDFRNGWTRAGSWMRPKDTEGACVPMLSGQICCGCGISIEAQQKALCLTCWQRWLPKHRTGFVCVEK